jgi:putative inorganic carbon (HCO3(-)) transporter
MILFYFLVGIMPLSEHHIWGRFVGDFTVFKYIGAACVVYAVVHLIATRSIPPYFRTWQARLFLVFCLMAAASYLSKGLPGAFEVSPLISYASFLLLFLITVTVVDSLNRLRWVMLVAIASVAFASLYMIREWQNNHNLYADYRPGGVVGDPNYFTISALFTLPLAFHLMLGSRRPWERLFCAGCLLMTVLAVTLGASRGGFLGLVAAFLFVVWHSRARLRNLVVAGGLVLPLSLLLPISPLGRLLHPSAGDQGAEDYRTVVWQAGLRMMAAHPIAGVGLGNFKPQVRGYELGDTNVTSIAHNAYVEIGAEMGLPALFVFLGILFSSHRTLGRVRVHAFRAQQPFVWQTALGLQAGLLGSAVAIFFVSGQYQKLLWLVIFLSVCMPALEGSRLGVGGRSEKSPGAGRLNSSAGLYSAAGLTEMTR